MTEPWTPPTVPEAVARLIRISEYAQALLVLHGPPMWVANDERTNKLVDALENPLLPHDWEILRAFVAEESRIVDADDVAALGYIRDWMEVCRTDGKLGGTLTASLDRLAALVEES